MQIDIIAFILICMAIFKGWQKGLIVALFSFVAFIVGMAAALKLSVAAARYLGDAVHISQRWLPVIAFVAVFVIVVLLIRLGAKLIEGAVNLVMLGWLNKLGGILLFLLIYFFIFSILLFYAGQLQLIKPATTQSSITFSYIQPIGPYVMNAIGSVIPLFRNMFDELLQFFDTAAGTKPAA
ncbi:MAG: CvpA family protein [Bacteroidota bacterium]